MHNQRLVMERANFVYLMHRGAGHIKTLHMAVQLHARKTLPKGLLQNLAGVGFAGIYGCHGRNLRMSPTNTGHISIQLAGNARLMRVMQRN